MTFDYISDFTDMGSGFPWEPMPDGAGGGPSWWQPALQTGLQVGSQVGAAVLSQNQQTGMLKEQLTSLVNQVEQALKQNLGAWQAHQIDASQAGERAWGLLNDMVRRLMQAGPQGQISAAERDRRIDPSKLRWDWIAWYIDPIPGATDLQVVSGGNTSVTNTPPGGLAVGPGLAVPGVGTIPWLWIGAGLFLLWMMKR